MSLMTQEAQLMSCGIISVECSSRTLYREPPTWNTSNWSCHFAYQCKSAVSNEWVWLQPAKKGFNSKFAARPQHGIFMRVGCPSSAGPSCFPKISTAIASIHWPMRLGTFLPLAKAHENVIHGQCAWEFYDLQDPQHYKSVHVDVDGNDEVIMQLKSKISLYSTVHSIYFEQKNNSFSPPLYATLYLALKPHYLISNSFFYCLSNNPIMR